MRLLNKGLTESIYNSILNEGSFGDEVGFGDFSSIDEMEEEFTNKLYSFFGKEPSDLDFSKFELHRGTSWTDDNPWMLVEATGLDDIYEDIIVEKGKSEYPNLYNLYQEDGLVIYETGLEVGRNHGDRNYFDVVVYNTTDIHYLTYEEMSSDQAKELEKKVDEESNRICAYMEGIIKEHYQELLDIMLNNEYIDPDDEEMVESAGTKKDGKNYTYKELEDIVYEDGDNSDVAVAFDDIGYKLKTNELLDLINKKNFKSKEEILDFIVNSKEVEKLRESLKEATDEDMAKLLKELKHRSEELEMKLLTDEDLKKIANEIKREGFFISNDIFTDDNDEYEWEKINDFLDKKIMTYFLKNSGSEHVGERQYVCNDCGLEFDEDELISTDDDGNDLCPACGSTDIVDTGDEALEESAGGKKEFKVGDKVKLRYISDNNEHNDKVGELTWIHKFKYYPNKNPDEFVYKYQGVITYPDGTEEMVYDLYRDGSGLVSPLEIVNESSDEAKRAPIRKYTAYVFNWVNDHGYTEEFKKVWDKYSAPEYDGMSTEEIMGLVFNELADENGFNGELFVSPAEFYDNEGLEESVKKNLKENAVNELVSWMYDNFPENSFYKEGKLENGKTVYYFDKHGDMEVVKKAIKDKFGDEVSFGTATSEYAPESREFVVIMDSDKVNLTKMDWDEGLEGYTYYTDEDNYIYAKNNESGRLYLCTDDGDPEQEIQDDMNYILTESDESGWVEVDSKSVSDSDGFTTDYTMYKNSDGKFICIFGDKDAYTPENSDPDWEAESEAEAKEWFDSYNGFDDMNEEISEVESIGSIEEIDGKKYYVAENTNNGFCYKNANTYNNEPDSICYLSEGAFDESEDEKLAVDYVEANKERLVDWGSADTKNSIRAQVRTMLEEDEYWYENNSGKKIEAKDFDDELVDIIADDAFYMVDWQTVNGYLLEREWDETVEDYYDKKFGSLKEAAKPKKKKAKKNKEDEKRVIMQQGNVTCFKENDSKYLVFENENDNEKEYSDQDSAMEDFMSRVGVDTDRKLKESVIVAGNKIPIRKRPTKNSV